MSNNDNKPRALYRTRHQCNVMLPNGERIEDGVMITTFYENGHIDVRMDDMTHARALAAQGITENVLEFHGDTQTVQKKFYEFPEPAQETQKFATTQRVNVPVGSRIMVVSTTHVAAGYELEYMGATHETHLNCEYTRYVYGHHAERDRVFVDPYEEVIVISRPPRSSERTYFNR